jgi:hypothetical protein
VSTRYERLLELYPGAVRRAGRVYPAAIDAPAGGADQPWGRLSIDPAPRSPDPALLRRGAVHLAKRQADDPSLTNGPTACWQGHGPEGVRVTRGRYLDMIATCDALRAEFEDSPASTPAADLPLRALAHELAGDPLTSGNGRDAAIGISVLLTVATGSAGGRAFVVGCRGHVSSDRNSWHVAPSGMLELNDVPDPIADTVATELAEELGIVVGADQVAARMTVLGLVHDLLRLKPDLVVRLDLSTAEVPAQLEAVSEFSELAFVPAERSALTAFWAAHEPSRLTPAAAGAIALFENALPT